MIFSTDLLSEMGGQILAIFKVSDQNDDVGSRAWIILRALSRSTRHPRAIRAAPEKFVFREADAQYLGENLALCLARGAVEDFTSILSPFIKDLIAMPRSFICSRPVLVRSLTL